MLKSVALRQATVPRRQHWRHGTLGILQAVRSIESSVVLHGWHLLLVAVAHVATWASDGLLWVEVVVGQPDRRCLRVLLRLLVLERGRVLRR